MPAILYTSNLGNSFNLNDNGIIIVAIGSSSNYVELPSLDEIEQMDRKRQQAIESLEISGNSVKC